MTTTANKAVVLHVPIDRITVGEQEREEFGDIPALARSIEKHTLLQPIGLTDDYQLVFGERRLRAVRLLGWNAIPANLLGNLTDEEIAAARVAENDDRLDLTPYERSKRKVEKAKEAAQILSSQSDDKPLPRGHKATYGVPKQEVADALGMSKGALINAEKHVAAAEKFPTFQQPQWKPSHVAEMSKHLDKLPEEERAEAVTLIDQPTMAPSDGIIVLAGLAEMAEPERKEVLALQYSDDPRDRDVAITRAAGEQPMPDGRVKILGDAIVTLKKARDFVSDDFKQDIAQLVRDVASIRDALKSADKERMEEERGKLHTTAA